MKTHHIGNVSKSTQSPAPTRALGPVTRVRSRDLPPGGGRRLRRGAPPVTAERKRRVLILSLLLGAGTVAVLAVAVLFWLLPQLERKSEAVALSRALTIPPTGVQQVVFPSPSREESLRLVREALDVRQLARIPQYFRMGPASAEEILHFLEETPVRDGTPDGFEWIGTFEIEGMPVEGVIASYRNSERRGQRIAYLTPDAEGNWKVDFGAYARATLPSWREVKEGAPQAVARVFIGPDFYYNGVFAKEEDWQSFNMSSPDTTPPLHGYCRRDTEVERDLIMLLADGRRIRRATVEIRRVAGGEPRQFEIVRLLAGDWIVPDEIAPTARN